MADQPQLDWNAADVHEGTLTVKVKGEYDDDGWGQTFTRTLALLSSSGSWGSVSFKKGKVKVKDVEEGSEGNVRFALDGAVQEANSRHAEDGSEDGSEDADDDESQDEDDSEADDTDRRMTERFRDSAD